MKKSATFTLSNYNDVLTVSEAARAIRVSPDGIHRLVRRGEIRKFNVTTRRVVIAKVDLIAFLDRQLAASDDRPIPFNPNPPKKKSVKK